MLCARHGHVKQAHLVLVQHQAPVNSLEAKIVGYFHRFPLQPLGRCLSFFRRPRWRH
ncbi:hypothetical protein P3T21_005072 [Paraburkholderia sp. GAS334]